MCEFLRTHTLDYFEVYQPCQQQPNHMISIWAIALTAKGLFCYDEQRLIDKKRPLRGLEK